MSTAPDIAPLRTPEEVAELLVHISPFTIRKMVQRREIAYTPGARGKVLFSASQIEALLHHMEVGPSTEPPAEDEGDSPFRTTGRSSARNRKAS